MQVKTFEALTIKDAVKAIKKELGQDAVILSTREKPVKGHAAAKMIEVTAAVPESASTPPSTRGIDDAARSDLAVRLQNLDLKISALAEAMPSRAHVNTLETGLHELKLLLLESMRGRDGSPLGELPTHLVNLDRQLRVMGIEEAQIAQLMKHLQNVAPPDDATKSRIDSLEDFYRGQAIRWMIKRVKIAPRWAVTEGTTSVQAFIGATGVGKTSLVAKLAAHYSLREKARVLLVSFDTYRLAAAEQLRIYSKIIGVPFVAITTPDELPDRIAEHRDMEVVLIDTAGRSPKNAQQLKDLEALRSQSLAIDAHLVLAATDKEGQMDRTIRYFSPIGIQSLAFSKLDESWSFGEIYNLSLKWTLPLSFFSTGQGVPEDLERASRERVIERIFGL